MADSSVYKIITLVGTSSESWEKAAEAAVSLAAKSLEDLRIAEVEALDLQIEDGKVLAVPTNKILSLYSRWTKPEDLNPMRLKAIEHFFEHYKDLEQGKWVKVAGWEGPESAHKEIMDGIAAYNKAQG